MRNSTRLTLIGAAVALAAGGLTQIERSARAIEQERLLHPAPTATMNLFGADAPAVPRRTARPRSIGGRS